MLGANFKPWGDLNWILSKYPRIKWDLIGCISTEDRFISTLKILKSANINRSLFFQIEDPKSKDTKLITQRLSISRERYLKFRNKPIEIEEHKLLEPVSIIVDSIRKFISETSGNVMLDISCFPKRFFFAITKLLVQSGIKNLIVTYTLPQKYCSEELSTNPDTWAHLPLFMSVTYPEPMIDLAIVGVGFMPFGLPKLLLGKYNATTVKLLFPFPPGPPNYQRTWEFVRKIEKTFTFKPSDGIIKVHANNLPEAYEYIMQETCGGTRNTIFAPYGPKPISLAICLYATKHNAPVYYTQPNNYNPNYSIGSKETLGYCIILDGKQLY